jgi:hypothetical protein
MAKGPKSTALDVFIAKKLEIDGMLQRLQALSDEHFNTHPDDIDWGDVGTISHYRDRLREICDSAFHEGEYAR